MQNARGWLDLPLLASPRMIAATIARWSSSILVRSGALAAVISRLLRSSGVSARGEFDKNWITRGFYDGRMQPKVVLCDLRPVGELFNCAVFLFDLAEPALYLLVSPPDGLL